MHADTLFDSGVGIEAASPSDFPAPFARDSVTQRLDQAQWFSADVPPLGKDSLGAFRLPGVDLVSFFHGTEEGDLVRFIIISWFVFILLIAYLRLYLPRPGARLRMKEREIFSSFREAPVFLYFKLVAVKAVSSISGLFTGYFALMAFGLHVPLGYLVVFLPIVWLISSIPITVMGLGTTQAAMLWLVAGFAQGSGGPEAIKAAVLAYSLLWWFSFSVGRFSIGAFFLFRLPKSIWAPQETDPSEHTLPQERKIRPMADNP